MSKPLLELQNLSGGYPPTSIFRDVNLTMGSSESIGLFGPNGHGKTTLLKTVAGLLDPWRGDIFMAGKRLNVEGEMQHRPSSHLNYDLFRKRRISASDAVSAGLIYVMQANTLFPEMTVEEVIEMAPAGARGRPGVREMREQVEELFPRLRERWTSKIRFLSGGERQMVSISVGLLAMPRLLILDEPTLGLAPKVREELAVSIHKIKKSGIPMLIVDQNIEFLFGLIDRLFLFDHGSITKVIERKNMPTHQEAMKMIFEGNDAVH